MIRCNACGETFEDYQELALHIQSKRDKAHRRGKRWAAKFIHNNIIARDKHSDKYGRTPLSENEVQNKLDNRRVLSGELIYTNTICLRGKHAVSQPLPIEYVNSTHAWRIQGRLVVICDKCRS